MIKSFPKIFAIGQDFIKDIFQDEVEITEKLDGSQFNFGKVNGNLVMRSKKKIIYEGEPNKQFEQAINYIYSIRDKIRDNTVYYCEFIGKNKHNVLEYGRTPKNGLVLFGVSSIGDTFESDYESLKQYAEELDIEVAPLLYKGMINKADELFDLLEKDSVLGNTKVEGVVVKNYHQPFLLGGQPIPLMSGKFVSEKFKEVHEKNWKKENTAKGRFEVYKENFRSEARWEKAIQHLRDSGELENAPQDIGKIIKEIQKDIEEEEKENIKEFLYKEFSPEIYRYAIKGVPEWYKEKLANKSFNNK